MHKDIIADRMARIDSSGIRKVFDLAAELDAPVNLSIGQPDFDVPEQIKAAAIDAIQKGNNKYTHTQGIAELNDAVRERYMRLYNFSADASLITSGVSGGILLALMTMINAGDSVILTDPYFVIYKHIVTLLGGTIKYLDTYPDFRIYKERLETLIRQSSEKPKLMIISSPSNPTGVVYSKEELAVIVSLCKEHDIFLIADEIYDNFVYDVPQASVAEIADTEDCLILNGFSKNTAMTGWRLGYALGPKELIQKMTILQQYTFICAPAPVQYAGLAALQYDNSEIIRTFTQRRDVMYQGLREIGYEVAQPDGAIYMFPKALGTSATDFVTKAVRNNLLIIPGNVFSERDTHFRISYSSDIKTIQSGLEILKKLYAAYQ